MWFGNWYDFYIVQKEVESDPDVDTDELKQKNKLTSNINEDIEQPLVHSSPMKEDGKASVQKDSSVINMINENEVTRSSVIQGV